MEIKIEAEEISPWQSQNQRLNSMYRVRQIQKMSEDRQIIEKRNKRFIQTQKTIHLTEMENVNPFRKQYSANKSHIDACPNFQNNKLKYELTNSIKMLVKNIHDGPVKKQKSEVRRGHGRSSFKDFLKKMRKQKIKQRQNSRISVQKMKFLKYLRYGVSQKNLHRFSEEESVLSHPYSKTKSYFCFNRNVA